MEKGNGATIPASPARHRVPHDTAWHGRGRLRPTCAGGSRWMSLSSRWILFNAMVSVRMEWDFQLFRVGGKNTPLASGGRGRAARTRDRRVENATAASVMRQEMLQRRSTPGHASSRRSPEGGGESADTKSCDSSCPAQSPWYHRPRPQDTQRHGRARAGFQRSISTSGHRAA